MTRQQQTSSAPASPVPASTPVEARKLAEGLMQIMSSLLGIVERETELVRAGNVREAMALETEKSQMSRQYVDAISKLTRSRDYLKQSTPELLTALHRHHDTFRAMLQVNLTVLATAHAVSEGIVRGVNGEMQRKSLPNGYTAGGQRAMPGPRHVTPLSVSRSL
jgi:Trp operon repressor